MDARSDRDWVQPTLGGLVPDLDEVILAKWRTLVWLRSRSRTREDEEPCRVALPDHSSDAIADLVAVVAHGSGQLSNDLPWRVAVGLTTVRFAQDQAARHAGSPACITGPTMI